jgi:hypothetical protein
MLAHTFRGSTWKTMLGLEDERLPLARSKRLHNRERAYR